MKPTLYDEVLTKETALEQVTLIANQRHYIETHLDLVGLKYKPTDITLIRERLDQGYRAIDVVIAYASIYRDEYEYEVLLKQSGLKSIDVPLAQLEPNELKGIPKFK